MALSDQSPAPLTPFALGAALWPSRTFKISIHHLDIGPHREEDATQVPGSPAPTVVPQS
jgi:hypothetical protein